MARNKHVHLKTLLEVNEREQISGNLVIADEHLIYKEKREVTFDNNRRLTTLFYHNLILIYKI